MEEQGKSTYSRRDFLKIFSATATGVYAAGVVPGFILTRDGMMAIPAAEGYLLVDTKKCQGCVSCMLSCSLVHEGKESLSLSRIQIIQNSFEKFPDDINIAQCRQCEDPLCVKACPTEALYVDESDGNVRRVDENKCVGCMQCIGACPFEPRRGLWNFEKKRAMKCDLCVDTPFWNEKGGPDGKQACVEVCPLKAIKFTSEIPVQKGDKGYRVNLRRDQWGKLGYPTD